MTDEPERLFKVGQLCEAKSFLTGYRGCWFRCKVSKYAGLRCHLEYYDFPDEKLITTKLYQSKGKGKQKQKHLMLRPRYPSIFKENDMQDVRDNSEVVIIVDDDWKLGDLVDWSSTSCFWSGIITELVGDGKAKVELYPKPEGEGETYDVFLKDLRPSLNWSPENGWTVPTQRGDPTRACARIINPVNKDTNTVAQEMEGATGPSIKKSSSSQISGNSLAISVESKTTGTAETASKNEMVAKKETKKRKANGASTESGKTSPAAEGSRRTFMQSPLRSNHSDNIEAAVLDLEEYLGKVRWLKNILVNGVPSSDVPEKPKWQFESTPK